MKSAPTFLVGGALSLWCSVAAAQGCGGMPAVNGLCIPPDSPTSPLHQAYGQSQTQASVQWEDRWGAIAVDYGTGDMGVAEGLGTDVEAEGLAVSRCSEDGAGNCKIILQYWNSCAAVAVSVPQAGGRMTTIRESTLALASRRAVSACLKWGRPCEVVYSACSLPVRIK